MIFDRDLNKEQLFIIDFINFVERTNIYDYIIIDMHYLNQWNWWSNYHAFWFRIRFECNENSFSSKQKISYSQNYQWSSKDLYNDICISWRNLGFPLILLHYYLLGTIISLGIIFSPVSFAQSQMSTSSFYC